MYVIFSGDYAKARVTDITSIIVIIRYKLYLPYDQYLSEPGKAGYSPVESALYNCLQRIGWSLCLAWVTFSCHNGYGGEH